MSLISKYACEICGREKEPSGAIWWIAVATGQCLTIRVWDGAVASHVQVKHLCGDEHRDQYVQRWANERKLAAECRMGEVGAQ